MSYLGCQKVGTAKIIWQHIIYCYTNCGDLVLPGMIQMRF